MKYDVVIIGASSAGLFAAEILAKNGRKVALFEKSNFEDPDARLYIITPGLFRVMPDINPSLIRQKIKKIELHTGTEKAEIQFSSPDLILDRMEFLLDLKKRAEISGAEIFMECEFLGFNSDKENPGVRIRLKGDEILVSTKNLISADGVNSQVRRSIFQNEIPAVPLLQAEVDLPLDWDENITKVWFNVDHTPYFYWVIPDKNRKAVAGLIAVNGVNIRRLLDDFLMDQDLQAISYQSGLAALHSPESEIESLVEDVQVFFVGDAAGQVKVSTVGGTVTGLFGGKAAAEAILTGSSYREKLRRTQWELDLHYFIRTLLDKMSGADYQNLVRSLTPPVLNC